MPRHFDPEPIIKAMYHSSEAEIQALRDENNSLRAECQELRGDISDLDEVVKGLKQEIKERDDSIDRITEMIPPSYDADDSPEGIIIHFLKDMQSLAQIIAKLTADYR